MSHKFILNKKTNKDGFFNLLKSLDENKLWSIIIKHQDIRSLEQNAKLHAMLTEISEQSTHLNEHFNVEDWKRLLVWQFRSECLTGDFGKTTEYFKQTEFRIIPSLDGRGLVQLGAQTRDFPKYVMAEFITWLDAYCIENNISVNYARQYDEQYY